MVEGPVKRFQLMLMTDGHHLPACCCVFLGDEESSPKSHCSSSGVFQLPLHLVPIWKAL